ncbi:MAG: YhcN/YlaJ family sporulation lipoprotein [Clostridia bacterium]|jgi:YhcN/YlaJ family sporulation lipoprotein|nr:YhcN/YlaJ family sporulation lipoprotein [Clostridia bacterium]
MPKKMAGLVAVLLLLSIFAFPACNMQRRPGPTNPPPSREVVPEVMPNTDQFNNDNMNNRMNQDNALAEQLASKVRTIEEVNKATVVVNGNQAWVGVDLKAGAGARLTEKLKTKIMEMVKVQSNQISTVYVTADADVVTRLKNIADDIAAGKPVSGFRDELNDITTRIMPKVQ